MKKIFIQIFALGLIAISSSLHAIPTTVTNVWTVTDAVNSHGLYTQGLHLGTPTTTNSFNFESDLRLTQYSDGTGSIFGHASANNVRWLIDLTLGGFNDDLNTQDPIKASKGGDPDLWEFYNTIAGTISTTGWVAEVVRTGPALQIGFGANDKTTDFGASTWLDVVTLNGNSSDYKWDLNMDLIAVPEPSIIALFGIGLLGLGLARRRKSQS